MTRGALPAGLASRHFTSLHDAWLPKRERALAERLRALPKRSLEVLLLNATKGRSFHPSITDFFQIWSHVCPSVEVTSASYFPEIHELHGAVAKKGLRTLAPDAAVEAVDSFDVVLAIGSSEALARLIQKPGLRAKLVQLDLGFRHQVFDWTKGAALEPSYLDPGRFEGVNPVLCYSCQPEPKVRGEIAQIHPEALFSYRWFDYIPIGFRHVHAFRADAPLFDVALLGTDARRYEDLLAGTSLAGLRVVFVGNVERAPAIAELARRTEVTLVSRVQESVYACVVAASRIVVIPMAYPRDNVLLSVVDAFAAGVPIVASRRSGFARLEAKAAPIALADDGDELMARARAWLDDETERRDVGARALAFAREHLDIYAILETIVREQLI